MQLNNGTMERALAMSQRDGIEITEKTAEGYFMAALAQEISTIKNLLNTAKGQKAATAMSNRMASRMQQ